MFCAPRRMFEFRIAFDTSHNAVKGGQTTISTSLIFVRSSFKSLTRSSASLAVLFIFQFPAMISFRSFCIRSLLNSSITAASGIVREHRHTRQHLAFEEFQACPAAGAHEGHFLAELGLVHRLHAVAAADDALRPLLSPPVR